MGTPIDAKTARDIARDEVGHHEAICAERYASLHSGQADLKAQMARLTGAVAKAAFAIFTGLLGLVCWLALELYKIKLGG